jgi:hypothetical protein
MRVIVVVTLAMLFLAHTPAVGQGARFAVKAGFTAADVIYDPETGTGDGYFQSLGGGVSVSLPLGPKVSFDTDLLYARKGTKAKVKFMDDMGQPYMMYETWHMDYIVASPMLRLRASSLGASPYVLAGGEIGYLIKSWSLQEAPSTHYKKEIDRMEQTARFDYGVTLGGGVDIPLHNDAFLFVEGRYVWGLTDVDVTQYIAPVTTRSRAFYVFGGFRF